MANKTTDRNIAKLGNKQDTTTTRLATEQTKDTQVNTTKKNTKKTEQKNKTSAM